MNLFDSLVDTALSKKPELTSLRTIVEKELLHHEILRVLSKRGFLTKLTFIGGTCLRACYGSNRLSEDLDFTGGADFNRESLSTMAITIIHELQTKYGLEVKISEPILETGNVDTWKITILTRPERKDLAMQRIHLDICSIPSYQREPHVLLNIYNIELGTSGLILQTESKTEILADKIVAFALRKNKIKHRDLWDISWLHQQGIQLSTELVNIKLKDHHCNTKDFLSIFNSRSQSLTNDKSIYIDFKNEMRRFLPTDVMYETIDSIIFWDALVLVIENFSTQLGSSLISVKN